LKIPKRKEKKKKGNMALSRRQGNEGHVERYTDPVDELFSPYDNFPLTPRMMNDTQLFPHHKMSMKPFAPLLSADLVESETDYHVHTDLPGVNKEDLDICFNDGIMTIKAERKEIYESNSIYQNIHKVERIFGKIQRSIAIPANADTDRAIASLKDGVLTIMFPKKSIKRARKITVG